MRTHGSDPSKRVDTLEDVRFMLIHRGQKRQVIRTQCCAKPLTAGFRYRVVLRQARVMPGPENETRNAVCELLEEVSRAPGHRRRSFRASLEAASVFPLGPVLDIQPDCITTGGKEWNIFSRLKLRSCFMNRTSNSALHLEIQISPPPPNPQARRENM